MKRYTKILVLLLVIGNCRSGYSYSELDSLLSLYERETEIGKKAQLSYNIGKLSYNNNPRLCKKIVGQIVRDSSRINDKVLLGNNMVVLGLLNRYQDKMDSAYYYFQYALNIGEVSNDQNLINLSNYNIALNYGKEGRYAESISALIKVLARFEKVGNITASIGVLHYIGNNFLLMKNNTMGLNYQRKALKYIDTLSILTKKQNSLKANILNSIGLIYVNMSNRDSATFYFEKSLKIKKEINNLYAWCNTKLNLCSLLPNKSNESIRCNKELLKVLTKLNDQTGIVKAKINLVTSYAARGELHRAIKESKELIDNYENLCENDDLAQLYRTIGRSFYLLGEYKKAYEYRLFYDQFQDSVRQEIYRQNILDITEKYQSEKKDKEISEQQLMILNAELKISNQEKGIVGISLFSISLILLVLVIMQVKKRKARAEKDMAIIEEREKGLKAIFVAQEEERKRIAKDLHDGVGQQISVVKMAFQRIVEDVSFEKPELKPELEKLNFLISETASDIRTISHQMMPKALIEYGLVEAIEDLLENTFERSRIQYSYENFGFIERLPSNLEVALYRIIQELLQNIIKHSEAKRVDIQLVKTKSYCILIVQDNGIGIEKDHVKRGLGMININNRLSTINGSINMDSEKDGHGTIVTIRIAL